MEKTIEAQDRTSWIATWQAGWAWMSLPIVSFLGGTWVFGEPLAELSSTALALALVLGGWMPLWRALTTTDWKMPLRRWRTWQEQAPLPRWPYLQSGTPGAAIHRALGQARSWWRGVGAPVLARPLRAVLSAMVLSLLLGAVLGRTALLLSALLLACAELAALWHEGAGRVGTGWEALGWVGLPWLLGASLGGPIALIGWLSALVVTVLVGFQALTSPLALLGPLVTSAFLLWQGHALAVGGMLLLAFPSWLLLLDSIRPARYRRAVALWLLLMLLLIAGALR